MPLWTRGFLERAEERAELALDLFIDASNAIACHLYSSFEKSRGGRTPAPTLRLLNNCAAHGAKILICISDDLRVRNTLTGCKRASAASALPPPESYSKLLRGF